MDGGGGGEGGGEVECIALKAELICVAYRWMEVLSADGEARKAIIILFRPRSWLTKKGLPCRTKGARGGGGLNGYVCGSPRGVVWPRGR